jgi:diguanylate cyclase (GGDEF)-like protein/PAS domain S-box-containing protein
MPFFHRLRGTNPLLRRFVAMMAHACRRMTRLLPIRGIAAPLEDQDRMMLAAGIFENATEGIVVANRSGIVLSVNRGFCAITGYSPEELIGTNLAQLRLDRQSDQIQANIAGALGHSGGWQGEICGRRKDGGRFLVQSNITPLSRAGRAPQHRLGLFSDISELRAKDEHIHTLAYRDGLTGLPNRRLLQDRLDHAIAVAKRGAQQVAVMFVGVDRFKAINDSLGHEIGDRLLQVIAERLKRSARDMDSICRWGGDEFVLVIENCRSAEEVRQVAEKIVSSARGPADLSVATMHASVSVGISLYPQDGDETTILLRNANAAMSAAKTAGRDTFHFFDGSMNTRMRRRLALENELRQAIERGELELLYQPKFSISGQCLNGLEALLRWRHATHGLIPPSDFIPLAEETGLIIPIGRWVLRETCRQIRRWEEAGYTPVPVAVNLSARHIGDTVLVEEICSIVEAEGVATTMIEIEVTETAVMGEPDRAIALLGLLRNRGFGIAVDDFGTGYSSLSYLGRLPLTTLKIDRSFVQDVESNADDAEIVRTIIAMANALALKVVAEGVETEGQLRFLERSDCDVIQGYLIARPLEAAMVESWLQERPGRAAIPTPVASFWEMAGPLTDPAT